MDVFFQWTDNPLHQPATQRDNGSPERPGAPAAPVLSFRTETMENAKGEIHWRVQYAAQEFSDSTKRGCREDEGQCSKSQSSFRDQSGW